jgi:hypothetical protein
MAASEAEIGGLRVEHCLKQVHIQEERASLVSNSANVSVGFPRTAPRRAHSRSTHTETSHSRLRKAFDTAAASRFTG